VSHPGKRIRDITTDEECPGSRAKGAHWPTIPPHRVPRSALRPTRQSEPSMIVEARAPTSNPASIPSSQTRRPPARAAALTRLRLLETHAGNAGMARLRTASIECQNRETSISRSAPRSSFPLPTNARQR
jgi:hypothetical protein